MLRRASGIKKLDFVNENYELQNSLIFKILLDPELGKRFLNKKKLTLKWGILLKILNIKVKKFCVTPLLFNFINI